MQIKNITEPYWMENNMSDNTPLESIEIYPKIVVYKNVFKDIDKIYSTLKESDNYTEDMIFPKWIQWSHFGEYLLPVIAKSYRHNVRVCDVEEVVAETDVQKDQKDLILQLVSNFFKVTKDYASRYGLNTFDEPARIAKDRNGNYIKDHKGYDVLEWEHVGPTICKYHISDELNRVGMSYHSDYVTERSESPGYKFAFTALAYFNDDYKGGELDFVINKKLFKYKPCAGDYIVFPSGHPDILTEDGYAYLHGVMPAEGTHKYFARMYWQHYYPGSDQWFENEEKFGKDVWESMQPELEEQYRLANPKRNEIVGGERIQ